MGVLGMCTKEAFTNIPILNAKGIPHVFLYVRLIYCMRKRASNKKGSGPRNSMKGVHVIGNHEIVDWKQSGKGNIRNSNCRFDPQKVRQRRPRLLYVFRVFVRLCHFVYA